MSQKCHHKWYETGAYDSGYQHVYTAFTHLVEQIDEDRRDEE